MEAIRPKLWDTMRNYSGKQFSKDAVSGIIVAIIALPLSIALALASGVAPEKGIYTAIVAGFLISFLGGSRVQIAGPTAAFATIVAGIAARDGMEGLITATIMDPVAMMISSASSDSISEISVFSRTSIPRFLIIRRYHSISSRSFSLKDGAAAWIKTPPS